MTNPYTFVRLGPIPSKEKPVLHGSYDGGSYTGRLTCTLTTQSPLFIYTPDPKRTKKISVKDKKGQTKQHEEAQFLLDEATGRPVIPGSSLKGAIRSVAEAVAISGACLTLYDPEDGRQKWIGQYEVPDGYTPCKQMEMCICCRLFGMTGGDDNNFLGKVSISEAQAQQFIYDEAMTLFILGEPKPHRHTSFYVAKDGKDIAGRKFYYHRPQGVITTTLRSDQNKTVTPVATGAVFSFTVSFVNLTEPELALLLYALELENGLGQKIGYGKPIGLGSAVIQVNKLEWLKPAGRYEALAGGVEVLTGESLQEFVDDRTRVYRDGQTTSLQDLRRVLILEHNLNIHYPDWGWFKANPTAGLDKAP